METMVDLYHRSATCSHCGILFQANHFTGSMESDPQSVLAVTFLDLFEYGNYDDAVRIFDENGWLEFDYPDLCIVFAEAFVRSFGARKLTFRDYRSVLQHRLHQYALWREREDDDPDLFSYAFVEERYIGMLRNWATDCWRSVDDEGFMGCMEALGKFRIGEMYTGRILYMLYNDRFTPDSIIALIDEYNAKTDRSRNEIIDDVVREVRRFDGDLCELFRRFMSLDMEEDMVVAARFCRSVIWTRQDEDTIRTLSRMFSDSYGMESNLTLGIGQSICQNIRSAPFVVMDMDHGSCGDGVSLRIEGPEGTVVDARETFGSSLTKTVFFKGMVPYDVHVGMDGLSEHFRMVPACTVQPMKAIECNRWGFKTEVGLASAGMVFVYRRITGSC